jgi:peptidoglycan hydrolase-like protein with peptidoglycan-binding domain
MGPATVAALKKFQCAKGIVCGGTAAVNGYGATGPRTRAALKGSGQGSGTATIPVTNYSLPVTSSFTRTLQLGSTGSDVKALQVFLNQKGFKIATTGTGSPGQESTYFGPATKTALIKYQIVNKITPASGVFGPLTRASLKN